MKVLQLVKNPWMYLLIIILIALIVRIINITFPFGDFDEGTYIATVRSFVGGHPLLTQTYLSQFPLFIYFLSFFYILSHAIVSLRLFSIICSLITILLIFLITKKRIGFLPALLIGIYLSVDSAFLIVSRTIQADIPWMCFTMISFYCLLLYEQKRKIYLFLLAGTAFGISILIKANGVFGIVFLFYIILLAKVTLKKKLLLMLIYFAPTIILFFLFIPFDQIPLLYHQAILVRLSFWSFDIKSFQSSLRKEYIMQEWIFFILGIASSIMIILQILKKKSLAPFFFEILVIIWFYITAGIFLIYNPLFAHHFVFLIIPQALLAAFLFNAIGKKSAALAIIIGFFSILFSTRGIENIVFPRMTAYDKNLTQTASFIQKTTLPNDKIITDEPIILYLANRDTLPEYVDLSYVRIESKNLQTKSFLFTLLHYGTREVIYASGRLEKLAGSEKILASIYEKKQFGSIRVYIAPYYFKSN